MLRDLHEACACAVPAANRISVRWLDFCKDAQKLLLPIEAAYLDCRPLPHELPLPSMKGVR